MGSAKVAEVAVLPGLGRAGQRCQGPWAEGAQPGARALSKVLNSTRLCPPAVHAAVALPLPQALASSLRRFTQNLSVFRRDVAEALRSEGSTEPCGLDMMS